MPKREGALVATRKGGIVICSGGHVHDIAAFAYWLFWEEQVVCSVVNLTRNDAKNFLALARSAPEIGRLPICVPTIAKRHCADSLGTVFRDLLEADDVILAATAAAGDEAYAKLSGAIDRGKRDGISGMRLGGRPDLPD
jgi:hypothetical protein